MNQAERIEVSQMSDASIAFIYALRDEIDDSPKYQRQSDIWSKSKKQLLLDSILNGFDIPKIYFHHHAPAKEKDGRLIRYSIIDGKQRLSAIWEFLDGKLRLSEDFTYLEDPSISLAGAHYNDLNKHLKIKLKFDGKTLPIINIRTSSDDLIDEMFYRLNEAAPLNAAEKRRAIGGCVANAILEIVNHDFFTKKIDISNFRSRHEDIAAKILLLESQDDICDTKKIHIDRFVRQMKTQPDVIAELTESTKAVLDKLIEVFDDKDHLLKNTGFIPQIYLVAKHFIKRDGCISFERGDVLDFEGARELNRTTATIFDDDDDLGKSLIDYELLEFDRLAQTPNDKSSIAFRVNILLKNLGFYK